MNVLHIYFCNLKRAKLYELLNSHLVRNSVSITVQKFLHDFFFWITWKFLIHTMGPDDFKLGRVVSPSHCHKQPTMKCDSLWLLNPRPAFHMPLWNFPQVWLYDERYSPDFQFWSDFPYIFTKSIAKKLSSNETSSLRAGLALRNIHWKDALKGIQTSFHSLDLLQLAHRPVWHQLYPSFPKRLWKSSGTLLGSASAYGSEHQEGIMEDTGLGKRSCGRNLEEMEGTRAFAVLVYRVTWEARLEAETSSWAPRREEPDVQPWLSSAGIQGLHAARDPRNGTWSSEKTRNMICISMCT